MTFAQGFSLSDPIFLVLLFCQLHPLGIQALILVLLEIKGERRRIEETLGIYVLQSAPSDQGNQGLYKASGISNMVGFFYQI